MRSDYEKKWYPLPLCSCGDEAVVKHGDKVICPKCYLKLMKG